MKKLHTVFLIGILLCAVVSQAQINKGAILLGGNIGAGTQSSKADAGTNKNNNLNISPVFGIAIKENLVLGLNLWFWSNKSETDRASSHQTQKNSEYGTGVFLRKYKPIGKSGFSAFIQGSLGYGDGKGSYEEAATKSEIRVHKVDISAYPGFSYTISKRLQLESGFNKLLSLSWYTQKQTITNTGSSSITSTQKGANLSTSLDNFASSLYLGFRVLLNKV
jgi:hypothetical protein